MINQFNPLILIDQVPVFNLDKFLSLPPRKIHRIEVLDEIYIIGNRSYGGIINVVSRKGDMAGIDLPDNSFFFDFSSFQVQEEITFPRYRDRSFKSDSPDYRSTLFWVPGINIKPGQNAELEFYTPDNNGDFLVLIRGIAKDGSLIQGKCSFRVE
jgi:hypothetical protein